ncbi:MAG: acetyl-CoA decarbonylase/synthase complex subunit delta [Candidatus Omnitrophica bacterium]|nr:acetyl-CoA decarbonylase/synthase complex subunit delta [Candidatus Omnitrophota bacterium]
MELSLEKWSGAVSTVSIGASKEEGGTRSAVLKVGGQKTLPYLSAEGQIPYRPQIAFEVWDIAPLDWPQELLRPYQAVIKDPLSWAQKCVTDYGAKSICLRLMAAHPDFGDRTAQQEADFIRDLLKKISVPLIITGCGDDAKDNLVLPVCCEAARGERCLVGSAMQDNYKTLVAAALADGHNIIAESPIDINIAKQLNILISDMGLGLERIVINPTIGALGYGLEYAYSIMERARLAALAGDRMMSSPFICFVGQESWRAKEAKDEAQRGILWEAITATALIQAGADILVMRHPKAIEKIEKYINSLTGD